MTKVVVNPAESSAGPREEKIVDRIYDAVIEQRLPPGTKLSETSLCEVFGVGRMRIRRALLLLSSRDIVDLRSNRGAYVSSPTPGQAREIFEARRAIEPSVCRHVVERAVDEDIARLKSHLESEQQAQHSRNRRLAIRLSGRFHVKLAEISTNHVMERIVKELVTRTSLIIGMFGAPGTANCHEDEHALLLKAFEDRDGEQAARLMIAHLNHIETQINLSSESRRDVDLAEVFQQS